MRRGMSRRARSSDPAPWRDDPLEECEERVGGQRKKDREHSPGQNLGAEEVLLDPLEDRAAEALRNEERRHGGDRDRGYRRDSQARDHGRRRQREFDLDERLQTRE